MTKNPIYNALLAALYIVAIASVMYFGTRLAGPRDATFLAPVAAISLFTLSAAVMGYVFIYQPFVMYFDGKKKQALDLFLQTVASFAVITIIILAALFSGLF